MDSCFWTKKDGISHADNAFYSSINLFQHGVKSFLQTKSKIKAHCSSFVAFLVLIFFSPFSLWTILEKHPGKRSFLSFKQRPELRREADWFTASCVAKNNKRSWGEKKKHETSLEMNLLNTLQNNVVWAVSYCDGRWIRVWLILPGVRCGVGEGASRVGVGASVLGVRWGLRLASKPCLKSLLGWAVGTVCECVCVELGVWGGDYTVTLFILFMHTRPLWVPLCRISVYLNLFWENSTWLGRGSL